MQPETEEAKPVEIPKIFSAGMAILRSQDKDWTLVSELVWSNMDWLKTVVCVNGDNTFKIYLDRVGWDWSISGYRVL
jgi:hypothetical protein